MEAFDKSAYKDNTIIVLWSDHGWHLGDKGHWKKFALWEETTHVPMLIVAPGITKPEQKCDRVVGSIDLYPTLLDLCGFEPNNTLDGQSLVPLLKDPAKDWDHPVLTTHSRGYNAIRTAKWRYIQYPKDGEAELYDRINDPLEHNNLIKNPEYAAVIAELKAHIPTEQAEEVVQVSKVVINVQTELLDRKKKIAGATYYDAQKRVYDAVIACESGEEEAVARALATEIFTKAIADGVYDPENLEKPGGAFASGKTDILVEKKKTKTKPEKASKAD
jgi:arylsulfatase A-like enzyme